MALKDLAVLVLAAGKSTRMKSAVPKVLHKVGGQTLIGHVLGVGRDAGADSLRVVVGADMDELTAAIDPIPTIVQDPPRGTGHAVQCAREALAGFDGTIAVLFGDTPLITPQTLDTMRAEAERSDLVVLGFRPDDPGAYGRLVQNDNGELEAIVEAKDATPEQLTIDLCNSGVMMFDATLCWSLIDGLSDNNKSGELYLTDLVAMARMAGKTCAVVEASADEVWGVNSRADLAVAEQAFQRRARQRMLEGGVTLLDPDSVYFSWDTALAPDVSVGPNVVFGPGVTIDTGTSIEAFCHIEGARVGSGARIGPFARLRPGAELGDEVHIGNFVEVKKARVADGAKANHLAYIGDAHIGEKTNIGAGTITANYDGFNKHSTHVGAGVSIGSNTVLVAPISVADGALVGAGSVVTSDVTQDTLTVVRAERRDIDNGAARFRAARSNQKREDNS
jgi:bifunctional UDP-N-acetylglucosamine pyrophosphorylase/glucosamine-1-phosphate N-acetyltransferase